MTREEAERQVRAVIAEVDPTQARDVADWLAEHYCPLDLQQMCTLANARCPEGHTQYENCHGVLVNAVVQLTADQPEAADETISPTKDTEPGPTITNPAQLIPAAADHLVVPGEVTTTRLQLPDGLSFAEWEALGGRLREVRNRLLWWLGDWCAYGERHYGDTYAAALAATDYEPGTLRNAKYVAQRIDPSRRRDNLSWSHHYEVAALEPAEADAWLDRAIAEHWSQKVLRAQLKAARSRLKEDTDVATIAVPPTIELEIEPPKIESPKIEQVDDDQRAGGAPGVGKDANAADDHRRIGAEYMITALQNTAAELRQVNVAVFAREPDAAQLLDRLSDALSILDRFRNALKLALADEAAGDGDAAHHPGERHQGDQQDRAACDPLRGAVT
jgi:hypothetical protein